MERHIAAFVSTYLRTAEIIIEDRSVAECYTHIHGVEKSKRYLKVIAPWYENTIAPDICNVI